MLKHNLFKPQVTGQLVTMVAEILINYRLQRQNKSIKFLSQVSTQLDHHSRKDYAVTF